jgi:SEC-C motif domain protein
MTNKTSCPCGSGKTFTDCCEVVLDDHSKALTALQLMRSRYTAYTLARNEYLKESWAPETRPEELDVEDSTIQWLGLDIEGYDQGEQADTEGTVTFTARFLSSGHHCKLQEQSRFIKRDNFWYYLDGKNNSSTRKTGRNEPCPCGSGKKFKKCCLKKGGSLQ